MLLCQIVKNVSQILSRLILALDCTCRILFSDDNTYGAMQLYATYYVCAYDRDKWDDVVNCAYTATVALVMRYFVSIQV